MPEGSGEVDDAVTVFVIVPGVVDAVRFRVSGAESPLASAACVHVTVVLLSAAGPARSLVPEAKLAPAGSGSVTVIGPEVAGPASPAPRPHRRRFRRQPTGSGEAVIDTDRSASGGGLDFVVTVVAVLFALEGSPAVPATVTVLVTVPPAFGAVTFSVSGADSPEDERSRACK